MNEQMNERMTKLIHEGIIRLMSGEWLNIWMHKRMNKWMNKWIGECMNNTITEWMTNERTNERTNEQIITTTLNVRLNGYIVIWSSSSGKQICVIYPVYHWVLVKFISV